MVGNSGRLSTRRTAGYTSAFLFVRALCKQQTKPKELGLSDYANLASVL